MGETESREQDEGGSDAAEAAVPKRSAKGIQREAAAMMEKREWVMTAFLT